MRRLLIVIFIFRSCAPTGDVPAVITNVKYLRVICEVTVSERE